MVSITLVALLHFSLRALAQSSSSTNHFQKYTISAPGINASFIPYGARLTNLYVNDKNGKPQDVVLGYDNGNQYLTDTETDHTYFGAVVGRYANRIKNGTFTVDGVTSHIPENDNKGHDTLHGGYIGYDQRNWTVVSSNETTITFSLLDQGFQGFPGTIITYATYTVSAGPQWTSRLVSIPLDEPTPIMLSNHVYWNLDAFANPSDTTVLNDTLYMPYAARYIEIDNIEVPNGTIGTVASSNNTFLDFTKPKTIGKDIASAVNACGLGCTGYDNAFILDRPRYAAPEATDLILLTMSSPVTGIQLDIRTNQQSFQLYTCDNLNGTIPVKKSQQHSTNGTTIKVPKYGCIVIETQQWIDGINNPQWGQDEYQIYTVETEPAVVFATYDFSIVESDSNSNSNSNNNVNCNNGVCTTASTMSSVMPTMAANASSTSGLINGNGNNCNNGTCSSTTTVATHPNATSMAPVQFTGAAVPLTQGQYVSTALIAALVGAAVAL